MKPKSAVRDERGLFLKGNPGGGRKALPFDLKKQCQDAAPRCIEVGLRLLESDDEKLRLEAAKWLVERGYGKAAQPVEGTDGPAIRMVQIVTSTEAEG